MRQRVQFLLHTRSKSFDYSWIYGLSDPSEERRLAEFLLTWLSVSQIYDLPPISAFCSWNSKLILLVARRSGRSDKEKRPIVERALFYWKQDRELNYSDVRLLYFELTDRMNKAIAEIPDDQVRAPRKVQDLEIDLGESAHKASPIEQEGWSLPAGLKVQGLAENPVVLATPSGWSFPKLLYPLLNAQVVRQHVICIGSSLPLSNRFDKNTTWIMSPPDRLDQDSITILNTSGNPITSAELDRISHSKHPEPPPLSRTKEETAQKSGSDFALVEPELEEWPETLGDGLVERSLALKSHEGLLAQFGFRKEREMRDTLIRLSLLVVRVEMDAPPDLVMAWSHLLAEVALFHSSCSSEIGRHWVQRLDYLKRITIERYSRSKDPWAEEFRTVCRDLQELIGFTP